MGNKLKTSPEVFAQEEKVPVREIPNSKSQITNKGVSFGQILNAFGEEHTAAFLGFKKLRHVDKKISKTPRLRKGRKGDKMTTNR
jgi:hypothetical protein